MNVCDVWKVDASLAQTDTGKIGKTGIMTATRGLHHYRYGSWRILGAGFFLRRVYLKYVENQTVSVRNISKKVPGKHKFRLLIAST